MSIESLKEKARRHEQREEWRKALEQYRLAIKTLEQEESVDIGLQNRVGDLLVRVGDLEDAAKSYLRAVDLYVEAGLANNAIAVCKKIVRSLPDYLEAHLRMGQIRAQQGFLPDARTSFLTYAEQMQQRGDLEESFRALVEFCGLAPDDVDLRVAVADQMLSHERESEAIEQFAIAYRAFRDRGDGLEAEEIVSRVRSFAPEVDLETYAPPAELEEEPTEVAVDLSAVEAAAAEVAVEAPMGFETTAWITPPAEVEEMVAADVAAESAAEAIEEAAEVGIEGTPAEAIEEAIEEAAAEAVEEVAAAADDLEHALPGSDEREEETLAPDLAATEWEPSEVGGSEDEAAELDAEDAPAPAAEVWEDGDTAAEPGSGWEPIEVEGPVDLTLVEAGAESEAPEDEKPMAAEAEWESEEPMAAEAEWEPEEPAVELPLLATEGEDAEWEDAEAEDAEAELVGPLGDAAAEEADVVEGEESEGAVELPFIEADPAGTIEEAIEEGVAEERASGERLEADEIRERIQRDPDDVPLHQRLVELAYRQDDPPALAEAYVGLGEALRRAGQEVEARTAFQQALDVDPQSETARGALGDAGEAPEPAPEVAAHQEYVDLGSLVLGDQGEKSTRFVVAYEEPSGDEDADFARMLSQFKEKVSQNLAVDDVRAHHDLGTAYREMGLLDEAVAEFQQALRASSGYLPSYEVLGQTFLEMGKPDAAARALERALDVEYEVEDEMLAIYYFLARAYEELGNKASAQEFYGRVFSLDINFADVTERLRALR